MSPIEEDLNHTHYPRPPGFHEFVSGHRYAPIEDYELFPHTSSGEKLTLAQLFNFESCHWVELYEECARRNYEEELVLYDLLNEDAATADGMEVDVDETTAEILIG
jgi:hypothetical protein